VLGAAAGALYALIPRSAGYGSGQRDLDQSDAGLCRRSVSRLPRARPFGGSGRVQLSEPLRSSTPSPPCDSVEAADCNLGAIIALVVVAAAAVLLGRTIKGFEIRVVGAAPRAARFGGFQFQSIDSFSPSPSPGALAGLAGIIEVAGPVGHLQPSFSPGYGFTAIIVAFLGRLNPIGILIAGLFLALTFIGGEQAQIAMKIRWMLPRSFRGFCCFYVLACDSLILYRFRLIFPSRQVHRGNI